MGGNLRKMPKTRNSSSRSLSVVRGSMLPTYTRDIVASVSARQHCLCSGNPNSLRNPKSYKLWGKNVGERRGPRSKKALWRFFLLIFTEKKYTYACVVSFISQNTPISIFPFIYINDPHTNTHTLLTHTTCVT